MTGSLAEMRDRAAQRDASIRQGGRDAYRARQPAETNPYLKSDPYGFPFQLWYTGWREELDAATARENETPEAGPVSAMKEG